jgi:ATP-binding protein involved in chromosome partitioning
MTETTHPRRNRVEAALRGVQDPNLDVDVFEAGLVAGIETDDDEVTVEAGISELDAAAREQVVQSMLAAIRDVDGVEHVDVEPAAGPTQVTGVGEFDRVIAVASAKGGVGKSTVAATLACGLAADEAVGLFDADIHGPNIPTLLDIAGPVRAGDDGRPRPVEARGGDATVEVMSVDLLEDGTPLAWRGAMAHDAISELFEETAWSVDDTLVIDLPPGTGDAVLTTLQEVPVSGVVVVTTPFETSVADTVRSIELFRDNDVPVLGAVVNMAAFTCPSCGDTHDLFSDGYDLPAPVLSEFAFTRDLQDRPAPGTVPDAAVGLVDAVDSAVENAWDVDAPEGAVDIRANPPGERREQVRKAFTALGSGDPFHLVSDRDPTPVVEFLADLSTGSTDAFDVDVERRTPDDWVLTTTRP